MEERGRRGKFQCCCVSLFCSHPISPFSLLDDDKDRGQAESCWPHCHWNSDNSSSNIADSSINFGRKQRHKLRTASLATTAARTATAPSISSMPTLHLLLLLQVPAVPVGPREARRQCAMIHVPPPSVSPLFLLSRALLSPSLSSLSSLLLLPLFHYATLTADRSWIMPAITADRREKGDIAQQRSFLGGERAVFTCCSRMDDAAMERVAGREENTLV